MSGPGQNKKLDLLAVTSLVLDLPGPANTDPTPQGGSPSRSTKTPTDNQSGSSNSPVQAPSTVTGHAAPTDGVSAATRAIAGVSKSAEHTTDISGLVAELAKASPETLGALAAAISAHVSQQGATLNPASSNQPQPQPQPTQPQPNPPLQPSPQPIAPQEQLQLHQQPQQQQQSRHKNTTALEQQMEGLKTQVTGLKDLIDKTTKLDKAVKLDISTIPPTDKLSADWQTALKTTIPTIEKELKEIREKIVELSKEKNSTQTHLGRVVELEKALDELNAHLALLLFRSEKLFKNDPQRRHGRNNRKLPEDPHIKFSKDHDDTVILLRNLNKEMHKLVAEVLICHRDIASRGGVEKLGQGAILSLCDDKAPRNFSCYSVLRELHLRGWIDLEGNNLTGLGLGKKLDFKYEGEYQKHGGRVSALYPSQWKWNTVAWGTVVAAPIASFLLVGALGATSLTVAVASAPLLAAGLVGIFAPSTAKAILNTTFDVKLKKDALGQALSPERMIAEAIGATFSLQQISQQVGALDYSVLSLNGTQSNDPYEIAVNPAITAVKRAVLYFDQIGKLSPTDARNLRAEYESALREVISKTPALTAAWSRFLDPAADKLRKLGGFGIFGSTGGGIGVFLGA